MLRFTPCTLPVFSTSIQQSLNVSMLDDVNPDPAPAFLQPAFPPESMIVTNNYQVEPPQNPNPNQYYYQSNQLSEHMSTQAYLLGDQAQNTGVSLETHGYYDHASSSINMKGAAAYASASSQRSSEWSVSPPSSVHLTEHSVATTPQWNMNAVSSMQQLADGENIGGDQASLALLIS